MNERIIKIGLESGMLNYVDNETPRHYFLSGHADEQDLAKFAELIVEQCAGIIESQDVDPSFKLRMSWAVKQYFGVEQ
jgi:hypothetical protein